MCTVLIVDDNAVLARLMESAFAAGGFQVHAASDGAAALRSLKTLALDLVVTDMIMPESDGVELIVAIKKRYPTIKVIAISGGYRVGPEDYLTLARHLGVDGVLAKPFRMAELTALAASVLDGRRRQCSPGSRQASAAALRGGG